MKNEPLLFKPDFFQKQISGPSDLARINDLVAMRPVGKTAEEILIKDVFPSLPQQEVAAGLVDMEREKQALKLQQVLEKTLRPWLVTPNLDGTPLPTLTAVELARKSGFSPAGVIGLINGCDITVTRGKRKYRAQCGTVIPPTQKRTIIDSTRRNEIGQLVPCQIKITEPIKYTIDEARKVSETTGSAIRINPKKVIKGARYESRSPGGGPVQRVRFQEQKVTGQIIKMAQERARVVFEPVNRLQTEVMPPQKIIEAKEAIKPEVKEIIDWFKLKGGKKWLRGINENGLARSLSDLTMGKKTDVLVWNCFDFNWRQDKPREYPACIINDDVEESIVINNFGRLQESIEYLSLLGSVTPVVLVPTNEANAPVWEYVQALNEREAIVDSTVAKLRQKLNRMPDGLTIEVMRWDDYLISRGIETKAEAYSLAGAGVIEAKLPEKRKTRMINDDRAYFEQFGITIPKQESEKRIPYYYGVYIGEGQAFAEIVRLERNVILLDLEEFRVGEMTALGAEGIVPIVSPLSTKEKLEYYRWKKDSISRKRENPT